MVKTDGLDEQDGKTKQNERHRPCRIRYIFKECVGVGQKSEWERAWGSREEKREVKKEKERGRDGR